MSSSNNRSQTMTMTQAEELHLYEVLFSIATVYLFYSLYHNGIVVGIVCFIAIYFAYQKILAQHNVEILPVDEKAVIITGCDSGFGFELAKSLLKQNYQVFAGSLNPDGGGALELNNYSVYSSQLYVMKLNISSEESIRQFAGVVQEFCCDIGLWALVNTAGSDMFGSVEFSTMEMFEKVMDVNYLGTVRTTKAFLPLIRKAKGRILNVTSCCGRLAMPNRAVYCPSKYAMEAFSNILRLEVQPFGIKVCVIEPDYDGGGSTLLAAKLEFLEVSLEQMWETASDNVRTTYGREYLYHLRKYVEEGKSTNYHPVVKSMIHAIQSTAPKYRYPNGGGRYFINITTALNYVASFLPESTMDYILQKIYLRNWPIPQSLLQQN